MMTLGGPTSYSRGDGDSFPGENQKVKSVLTQHCLLAVNEVSPHVVNCPVQEPRSSGIDVTCQQSDPEMDSSALGILTHQDCVVVNISCFQSITIIGE